MGAGMWCGGYLVLMANDTRQRLGELAVVGNASRKFGSARDYLAAYVEAPDGEVLPLMMTWNEFNKLRNRADTNPEDMPGYRKRFTEKFRRR